MSKKSIIIALFAVTTLGVSACGEGKENDGQLAYEETYVDETQVVSTEVVSQGIPMTREYAIGHGILTEEELIGIDFETMAELFDLVEGKEKQMDLRATLLRLKDDFPAPGYGFDYQYLEDNEKSTETMTTEDFATIKVIVLQCSSGNYSASVLFDLEEKQAYWAENAPLVERGVEPTEQKELSDEQVEELKALLRDNHVEEWDVLYEGTNEGTTGDGSWQLYYELEDGRIYKHAGYGVLGNNAPDTYLNVKEILVEYFSIPI